MDDFSELSFGANVVTEDGTPMVVVARAYGNYAAFTMRTKYEEEYFYSKDGYVWGPLPRYISRNGKQYNTDKNPKLLEEWKRKMKIKEITYNPKATQPTD